MTLPWLVGNSFLVPISSILFNLDVLTIPDITVVHDKLFALPLSKR